MLWLGKLSLQIACWSTFLNNFFILIFIYFKSLCLLYSVLATLLSKRSRMSFTLLPHKSYHSSYRNINQNHWCQNRLTSWFSHIIKILLPFSLNTLLPISLAQECICLISQTIINCLLSQFNNNKLLTSQLKAFLSLIINNCINQISLPLHYPPMLSIAKASKPSTFSFAFCFLYQNI